MDQETTDNTNENNALETLRCIFCQRTVVWQVREPYPQACLYCGRWPAYTATTRCAHGVPLDGDCIRCDAGDVIPPGK